MLTYADVCLQVSKEQIVSIDWGLDPKRMLFKGHAHVSFTNSATAAAAVSRTGDELLGRPLKVSLAPDPPELRHTLPDAPSDGTSAQPLKAAEPPEKAFYVCRPKSLN